VASIFSTNVFCLLSTLSTKCLGVIFSPTTLIYFFHSFSVPLDLLGCSALFSLIGGGNNFSSGFKICLGTTGIGLLDSEEFE